ncbi:hypothetical protein HanIR_Chr10g0480591 [Helianthus annuus]|nr:hypothetical protein HanIR_Chr10g0480591 [Helianthus annuus]
MCVKEASPPSLSHNLISPAICQPVLRRPASPTNPPKTHRALSFPFTGDFSVTHHHPPSPRFTVNLTLQPPPPSFFPETSSGGAAPVVSAASMKRVVVDSWRGGVLMGDGGVFDGRRRC